MIRVIITILISYVVLTGLSPFRSGGPATVNGEGYTGAPCDDFRTCRSCHIISFAYGPTTEELRLIDPTTGQPVTYYTPGVTYDLEVEVIKSRGGFALYGFQATVIGEDSLNIGTWLEPSNNTQIATITTPCNSPRTYIEHTAPAGTNIFTAQWQAPSVVGSIASFYVSSNVVNGDGSTSGDSGSPGTVYHFPPPPPGHLILSDSIASGSYLAIDSITALAPVKEQAEVILRASGSVRFDSLFMVPQSSIIETVIDSL